MAKEFIKCVYDTFNTEFAESLAYELMANIRHADRRDIIPEVDGFVVVRGSIMYSDILYVYRDLAGRLLCVAGITKPSIDIVGREIWMFGTHYVYAYKRELLITEAKKIIKEWLDKYLLLTNMVNVINKTSIRWLKHMGAVFTPDIITLGTTKFQSFFMVNKEVLKNV